MVRERAAVVLTLLAIPASVHGQSFQGFELRADNDYFNFWRPPAQRPDENYTQGTRFGLALSSCDGKPRVGCGELELGVGQEIYTPFQDAPTPIEGDRPYAGLLYTELARSTVRDFGSQRLSVRVGVTGGPSLAEQTQSSFHRRFGFREPLGWAHQIPFEVGVSLAYGERRSTWRAGENGRQISVDLEWLATAGTIYSGLDFGAQIRGHVGDGRVWPRVDVGFAPVSSLVLRDLFLDGSTWGESHSVRRNLMVSTARSTVGLEWKSVRVEYQVTSSSKAFRSQPRSHTYGTITLALGG